MGRTVKTKHKAPWCNLAPSQWAIPPCFIKHAPSAEWAHLTEESPFYSSLERWIHPYWPNYSSLFVSLLIPSRMLACIQMRRWVQLAFLLHFETTRSACIRLRSWCFGASIQAVSLRNRGQRAFVHNPTSAFSLQMLRSLIRWSYPSGSQSIIHLGFPHREYERRGVLETRGSTSPTLLNFPVNSPFPISQIELYLDLLGKAIAYRTVHRRMRTQTMRYKIDMSESLAKIHTLSRPSFKHQVKVSAIS